MKYIAGAMIIASCILATGCVHRVVTVEPKYANPKTKNQYGGNHTKYVDDRIIWFWQDGFRNPEE